MIEQLNVIFNSLGLLFLVVASGYASNLLSCGIQGYFTNKMWTKHVLVFLTIFFYILLFSRDAYKKSIDDEWIFPEILLSALAIYIAFVLMGKLQPTYVVLVLIALSLHMLVSLEKENKNEKLAKVLNFVQLVLVCFVCLVIVIGAVIYLYKQKTERGADFDFGTFMLGVPKCDKLKS